MITEAAVTARITGAAVSARITGAAVLASSTKSDISQLVHTVQYCKVTFYGLSALPKQFNFDNKRDHVVMWSCGPHHSKGTTENLCKMDLKKILLSLFLGLFIFFALFQLKGQANVVLPLCSTT